MLQNICEHQKAEAIKQNGREVTIEEIGALIDKECTSELWFAIKHLTAPLSIFLLIGSFVLLYFQQLYPAVAVEFISFILITHFATKNATITTIEGKGRTGEWWREYELGFYILGTINFVYLFFLVYKLTDSYWMPIVIVFCLRYITAKLASKQAANDYFRVRGFSQAYNYAKLNGMTV